MWGAGGRFSSAPVQAPGFARGGDHCEHATRAYEGDLRVEPPAGSWGSAAGGVSLKLSESLLSIFTQKRAQKLRILLTARLHIRALGGRLLLAVAAMTHPLILVSWGRLHGPPVPGFASAPFNSGKTSQSHSVQAVLFPCAAKLDTVSHPVSAWETECPCLLWSD